MEFGPPSSHQTHLCRAQINFIKACHADHHVAALGGAEIRQRILEVLPATRFYAYDHDIGTGRADLDFRTSFPVRPQYTSRIPGVTTNSVLAPNRSTDRFLSYFGNASYTFKTRYVLSGSMRWDGSNLLGVKTNQRGTALWSVGGSWELSKESFFRINWLPYLRLRTTYGSAGNIDKSQSHYPTISVGTNSLTGLRQSSLQHPGNPSLRWEQVNTFNVGLDWRLFNNRISGSAEYYSKNAKHLLGDNLMDPTLGVTGTYKVNYATLNTQGLDVQINSENLKGVFAWTTNALFSYIYNRITSIDVPEPTYDNNYVTTTIREANRSIDHIYAYPWYGLNPQTGYPLIYINGEVSDDYVSYHRNIQKEELVSAGVTVPPYFGSLQNTFKWKELSLSILITFKAGHVFRRSSIGPGQEYVTSAPVYHMDYFKRWQKPGDELHTDVPAWAETTAPNQRFGLYQGSEALITSGSHVRMQDISLSYAFETANWQYVKGCRIYAYARNLGLLWKANDNGLDPDYAQSDYVAPKTVAVGIQMNF